MSDLLPAIRALTAFRAPATLPPCDLDELAPVLVAHGLAPLASYQVEHTRLGAGLPTASASRCSASTRGPSTTTCCAWSRCATP